MERKVLKETKWAVAVTLLAALIATPLLLFAAYTVEARPDNYYIKEHGWQTIKVCGGYELRIPPGWSADDYKKVTPLDCGIYPPRHPHSPNFR